MIKIDYKSGLSLYEQITEGIKSLIINNILSENEQLPSVRELSIELTVNPNTVQKAYKELELGGFIYSVKGKGNFVAPVSYARNSQKTRELYEDMQSTIKQLIYLGESFDDIVGVINKIKEEAI